MSLQVNDKTYCTDPQGFMCDWTEWEPAIAVKMANDDGVVLNELHWEVLGFLREYYQEFEIAPDFRTMSRSLSRVFGAEKADKVRLQTLFRPVQSACRYAGLPNPPAGVCV